MRVRVWISGAEGASRDFELVSAPRVGERISIACGQTVEEGVVAGVTWQLQAMEIGANELGLEAEPLGSVSMVHVICRPPTEGVAAAAAAASVGET